MSNTKAELLLRERHVFDSRAFVELVVWRVPRPVWGSCHNFKYRLAFVINGTCVLRYDNEAGKGDHRHVLGVEKPYEFTDTDTLLDHFWHDVRDWRLE